MPPSPRTHRHLSFSQAQMQELLNNPPTAGSADPAFAGRDWHCITVGELVDRANLRFVEWNTSVEDATNVSPRVLAVPIGVGMLICAAGPD